MGLAEDEVPTALDFTHPDCFVDLCRRHGPAVHAYLSRRAGRQGADDLFGEVWLRAFRARATYDPRYPDPRPWLYGIARNILRAHWQRQHRPECALGGITPDPWDDADVRMDAENQRAQLRRALDLLSPDEREVLLLVAWERLTPAEVAVALGIPQGTARSRLHRARHLLQREIFPSHVPASLSRSTQETTS